ncbi:hypothetical protein JZ751_013302, partial [Albula glossodonta]
MGRGWGEGGYNSPVCARRHGELWKEALRQTDNGVIVRGPGTDRGSGTKPAAHGPQGATETGQCTVLLGPAGFCWVPLGPSGSLWVLLGLAGSCWVLLGPAGFCWVLLGSGFLQAPVSCCYTTTSVQQREPEGQRALTTPFPECIGPRMSSPRASPPPPSECSPERGQEQPLECPSSPPGLDIDPPSMGSPVLSPDSSSHDATLSAPAGSPADSENLSPDELELLAKLEEQNRLLEADSKSMRSMSGSRRNSGSSLVSSSSASSNLSHLEEDTWILWGRIVNEWEEWRRKKDKLLKELIRKGIPHHFRAIVWQLLGNATDMPVKNQYSELLKMSSPCEKLIRRDIARTYPEHDFFKGQDSLGQEVLFNVMKAYSLVDREVGYCQGSAFIVGLLLMQMPEEEAFCVFVRLMQEYRLRELFKPSMAELGLCIYQFEYLLQVRATSTQYLLQVRATPTQYLLQVRAMPTQYLLQVRATPTQYLLQVSATPTQYLLQVRATSIQYLLLEQLPELNVHFRSQSFHTSMYASSWFLTLFLTFLPLPVATRVFDIFMYEGLEIIFRVGMAILQYNQTDLMQLDMEGMSQHFQKVIPHQFDSCPDKLILRAYQVKYNPKKMKKLEKEYTTIKNKEMEEQIEIKRLRTENRLLKQRIETLEKESAALADRLIQGQVTRALEAEENYVIKRELAVVRQQCSTASENLERAQDTIRELEQRK